jgi:hypothetical protein
MLIALRTAVALLLDSASESLRMIRSKTLPEALNGLGSSSSPRTLCDLTLDFQTATSINDSLTFYMNEAMLSTQQSRLLARSTRHKLHPPTPVDNKNSHGGQAS